MVRLDGREWHAFRVGGLFDLAMRGRRLRKADHVTGDTPYVSSSAMRNGVDGFIEPTDGCRTFSDCLTMANSGSVGSTFWQSFGFVASDHVTALRHDGLDGDGHLFLSVVLATQGGNFSFNREITDGRLRRMRIMLPVDTATGEPDWAFMEAYVAERRERLLAAARAFLSRRLEALRRAAQADGDAGDGLDGREWHAFRVGGLFDITSGRPLERYRRHDGDIPYIGTSVINNGVTDFVANDNGAKDRNVIGVNADGTPCVAFYHPYTCMFSSIVRRCHLKGHEENEPLGLFLSMAITMQRGKFTYGYKCGTTRLARQLVMLPVNPATGKPDWAFMEAYARHIMLARTEEAYAFLERAAATTEA